MKKLCACAVALALLSVSCKQKGTDAVVEPETSIEDYDVAPVAVPQAATVESVMIAGGYWQLLTEGDNAGKMKWVEYAVPGTVVQAYANTDPFNPDDAAETMRDVVRTTDGQKRDFIHIVFNGREYWAQDYSIVVNARPGVVMGTAAYVFSQPSPDAMGDQKFDLGTVVGVWNDGTGASSSPYAANYVKMSAYVGSRLTEGRYLSKDAVSTAAEDLLAMQIYGKLAARGDDGAYTLSDPVARAELVETALRFDLPATVEGLFQDLAFQKEARSGTTEEH